MIGSIFPDEINAALDQKVIELAICRIEKFKDGSPPGCGKPAVDVLKFHSEGVERSGHHLKISKSRLCYRRYRCTCGKLWVAAHVSCDLPAGFESDDNDIAKYCVAPDPRDDIGADEPIIV